MFGIFVDFVLCGAIPKPITSHQRKKTQQNTIKKIVAMLSRGNVSLQAGKYIDSNAIEAIRKENAEYDFRH